MSVDRKKDGNISVNTDTSIIEVNVYRKEGEFEEWVERCAKLVTACAHTFKETEQYFLVQCDAQPLDKKDKRMKEFQFHLVMNHCKDKLEHQGLELSFDMTDEEIERWDKENNDMILEAMYSSPEHFGLSIRGYYLPQTERNKVFYAQNCIETKEMRKHSKIATKTVKMQDISFLFEETTEEYQCNGGGGSLMQQLVVFNGVSEEDIQKRTPRFISYICVLSEMGKLPPCGKG